MSRTDPIQKTSVGIYYTEAIEKNKAELLAASLELPITTDKDGFDFVLSYINNRLCLSMMSKPSMQGHICVEFVQGAAGYRRKHGKKEMLLKAIGFHKSKPLSVLDVTGGMGKDGFLMASYGCHVHMLEKNTIVAALLEDGLIRAHQHPDTYDIVERITLSVQNSVQFLSTEEDLEENYDVIYLDPMFPKRNKSALVKKEMQMLQKMIGLEDDTEQLFTSALAAGVKRVVVKRPKTALPLENRKPSHSLQGKTTRFDVYIT